jgi:SnoaL-like protein
VTHVPATATETTAAATGAIDAEAFAADAERITNNVLLDEWLAVYADDAVAEWIADGAYERHAGIEAIREAATAMAGVWRDHRLHVKKTVQCSDAETVALTWTGGFGQDDRQFGTEIWTFRDGLVVRHQMYAYLDVRPSTSLVARLRILMTAPRLALSLVRHQRRARAARA